MKYTIYFEWLDSQKDSVICYNAKERDDIIKNTMLRYRGCFKEISYSRIYKSGEYGKRTKVL